MAHEIPAGGVQVRELAWDASHPLDAAARLAGVDVSAAGWALDLYRGEATRGHEDLEVGHAPGQHRGGSI